MINIKFSEDEKSHHLGFELIGSVLESPLHGHIRSAVEALVETLGNYAKLLTRAEETLPVPPVIESANDYTCIDLTLSPEGFIIGRIAFHVIRTGFHRLAACYPEYIHIEIEGTHNE